MRKWTALCLLLLLALTGCTQTAAKQVWSPVDADLQETASVFTLDGRELTCFCGADGAPYLDLTELADVLGGSLEITELPGRIGHQLCRWEYDGGARNYSTLRESVWDGTHWLVPAAQFWQSMDFCSLADTDRTYYVSQPRSRKLPAGRRMAVLMYHALGDDIWGEEQLFVSPSILRQQLQYLQDNGFTTLFYEDLPDLDTVEKPVLITFDDGYADNYEYLFPLLQEFGMKATIFIAPENLGRPHFLTEEQVREMADSGLVAIESHTLNHLQLDTLSREEADRQIEESRLAIARITGRIPLAFSYPEGRFNRHVQKTARETYLYATCCTRKAYVTGRSPLYLIPRLAVQRRTTMEEFAAMVEQET